MMRHIGWWLSLDNVESLEAINLSLGAPWAHGRGWLLAGGCLFTLGMAVLFYHRCEVRTSRPLRLTLTALRAAAWCLLLITLAAPHLHSSVTTERPALIYVVVDDTESMGGTRAESLRDLFSPAGRDFVGDLERRLQCHVETFLFSGDTATELQRVSSSELANALQQDGQVTSLTIMFEQLQRQKDARRAVAAIVFSDFVHNSGPAPSDELRDALGIPVYAVGVGDTEIADLALELRAESTVQRGQPTTVYVDLRQSGFANQSAVVSLEMRSLEQVVDQTPSVPAVESTSSRPTPVVQRRVELTAEAMAIEITLTPEFSGMMEVTARVEPLEQELVLDNNVAHRQVRVIEDHLRLTYVAYEPTWEWRFMKEVFQRDQLVTEPGFRTFLASTDPQVQRTNELFLSSLTPPRTEFFANDVLFLEDLPSELLSEDFCGLVEEFVRELGGGLVVINGPRFGLGPLLDTSLAKLLPVIGDVTLKRRDEREFEIQRTPESQLYSFMQLADSEVENEAAWRNLGSLPWYQPVAGVHEQAHVLMRHPTDVCRDGATLQPLIAIRPYGKGQVVYVGINEMWRLRKRYGERYYQRFWSQMIYRLGMSQAPGSDKRFVPRFDRSTYRVGTIAVLTVEAFDADYQPLDTQRFPSGHLKAEVIFPEAAGRENQKVSIPRKSDGLFETTLQIDVPGRYTVKITDPVTGSVHERSLEATVASAERRHVARDAVLQRRIADGSGGHAYELNEIDRLLADMHYPPTLVREQRQSALWHTPLWFLLVIGLLLGEWSLRKFLFLR